MFLKQCKGNPFTNARVENAHKTQETSSFGCILAALLVFQHRDLAKIKTGQVSLQSKTVKNNISLVASFGTSPESIRTKISYVLLTIHFPFKPPVGWGGHPQVSTQSNVETHFHHAHGIHVCHIYLHLGSLSKYTIHWASSPWFNPATHQHSHTPRQTQVRTNDGT